MTPNRAIVLAVAVVSLLGLAVELAQPNEFLVTTFSLSYEGNVPTWTASILLFGCALLMWERRLRVLAVAFAYVSLDEVAGFHEHFSDVIHLDGVLRYSWVIPATVFVILLAIVAIPLIKAYPRVLVAGLLYVGGAVVMELPLGWWVTHKGDDQGLVYALIDWVEETLELAGATLFVTTFLAARSASSAPTR